MLIKSANRVDFVGGSLDLYPIYIFQFHTYTLNAAINIYSKVEITPQENKYIIESKDLNLKEEFYSLKDLINNSKFKLLTQLLRNFPDTPYFKITSENEAFFGSGIGASSALLISLIKAILHINKITLQTNEIINLAANIEARVIHIPTGKQDYIAALLKGVNIITFFDFGFKVKQLKSEKVIENLNKHIILAFTGKSHNSAVTNWQIIKKYIEKDESVMNLINKLNNNAYQSIESLTNNDIEKFCYFIKEDWNIRRKLTPEVSNDYLDNHIENIYKLGAWAVKLTGAGGGGTMLILSDEEKKEDIINYLNKNSMPIIKANIIE